MQSRLTLRVAVCDRHRYIDARRVRRCNRVTPDQGGLDEWLDSALQIKVAPGPDTLTPLRSEGVVRQGNRQAGKAVAAACKRE